jgi:D-glycero-D-manno-heptose 1,7-bisphosphate phosphatase
VSGRRRRAVFLDRDGTLIEDVSYLRDPAQVRLLPGVGPAVKRLNEAHFLAIVATNQSGIARGFLREDEYLATQRRVDELLSEYGATLDAHYHCPHLPETDGPCRCRKPGPLLYEQASERFGINLAESWWIGDRLRDVEPARLFGGRGILVESGPVSPGGDAQFPRVPDLSAAVEAVLAAPSLNYLPPP